MQLDQVTYWDGTDAAPEGQYPVYDDATGLPFASDPGNGTNQWQEPNPTGTTPLAQTGWQNPICYSSGSTMTTFVQFKVPAGGATMWSNFTNMRIKGVGVSDPGQSDDSTGYNFTNGGNGYPATYSSTNNTIAPNVSGMTCDKAFPSGAVDYFGPITVQWYFSVDGGNTWALVGSSKNECFVTLTAPNLTPTVNTGLPGSTTTAPDPKYKLFQTVLHYACSNFGATSNDTAVANTWALFSGPQNICAWNPSDKKYDRKLYYYGASRGFGGSQPVNTKDLLAASDGDGECYSFGELFQDALWANGIDNNGIRITPTNTTPSNPIVFLVKDFTPSTTGSMPSSAAPYSWEMTFSSSAGEMQPPPVNTGYGIYGDFINLGKLYGQNTAPAPPMEKVFGNHYIVQYGSSYYDPSYGATYTSANDFETQSVKGYGQGISGDNVDLEVELVPSSGLQNITFTSFTIPHNFGD